MKFFKPSELVNSQFRLIKVDGNTYSKWDDHEKKFLKSDEPHQGYSRKWKLNIKTVKEEGFLEASDNIMSQILLESFAKDVEPIGQVIHLKSNGKEGMEIRYFCNIMKPEKPDFTFHTEEYKTDDKAIEDEVNNIAF